MKNLKKFRNNLSKAGIKTELVSPDNWLTTGNYALNFLLTGDWERGIPNRRSTLLWGPKGSGKSFLSARIAADAQTKGYHVVYIDSETAADHTFLQNAGVSTDEDVFTPVIAPTLENAYNIMSELFQNSDPEDKTFVVLDSLSMMVSEKEMGDFKKSDMKGDQGQNSKKLKLFMKMVNAHIMDYDMFFVATGHAYVNQDLQNGKGTRIFSGGEGVEFIPSISVYIDRLKLKGTDQVDGIRIKVEVNKTRFTKPFGRMTLEVPYTTGIDPIDGLLEMAEDAELVNKNGAWYSYERTNGDVVKFQRKDFVKYYREIMGFDEEYEIEEKNDAEANEEAVQST